MQIRLAPVLLATVLVSACFKPDADALLDKARQHLTKHETNAALVSIKAALQAAPQSAAARFLFGETLLAGGDFAGAEVELRKALELKHPPDQVVPVLARALLRQGKWNDLVDAYGSTELQSASARADLKTSVATAFALRGMTAEAAAALDLALQAQPDFVAAQALQMRMNMGKRDVVAAMAGLNQLLEKHPQDSNVWKLKGDFARTINPDPQAALSAYRKAIELDANNIDAHADAVGLLFEQNDLAGVTAQLAKMKTVAGKHPHTLFFEARLAYRRGDLPAARAALQQVFRRAPDHAPALELAGATELLLNSPTQARAFLAKAVQAAPQRALSRRLLAQAQLALGDGDAALATLQPLLAGNDPRSLSLAGEAYLAKGQLDQANKFYARAVKLNPDDLRSRTALAATTVQKGSLDKGLEELAAISAVDKGTLADLAIAVAHLASGKFGPALAAIDVIEKKRPTDPFPANLRGRAQLMKGDKDAARASFEKALTIRPGYYAAAANLATLDLADNRLEDAKRRFTALLAANPKDVQTLLALEQLLARTNAPEQERVKLIEEAIRADGADPKPRVRLIDHHLQRQDGAKAMEAARNAVAALPDNLLVLEAMARAQFQAGDLNQALSTYTKLASAQPESAQAQFALATAQRSAGNLDGARQNLKRALALSPDALKAQEYLVAVELEARHYDAALTVARQVQKQRPKSRPGYLLEGDVEFARRNYGASLKAYQTALAVEPSTATATRVHSTLLALKRGPEAEQFTSDWVKKHPKDGSFFAYLGDTALMQQDFESAEKNYRAAIEAAPDHAIALNNLALTLYRQNKRGGLDFAIQADKVSPNTPAIMDTLAYLLSAEGQQHQRAIDLQKRAMTLDPKNPQLKLTLARIYLKAGKKSLAETELLELARLGKRFPGQQTVADLLKVATQRSPAGPASASAR